MIRYVIDASVALKWLLKETYRVEARWYVDTDLIRIAPDLLLIECTNAIRRKVLLKQITQDIGDDAFHFLLNWHKELLVLYPSVDLLQRAYELSKELEQYPIPDCLYLALSEREQAILVTADRKFYERVRASDYSRYIVWIEEPPYANPPL